MDRYDLYELAATEPARTIPFLLAAHAGSPHVLGEDFCGSGALARAWAESDPSRTTVAVDRDAGALDELTKRLDSSAASRVQLRECDVLRAADPVDILAAFNFPIGYFHERANLLDYLRHVRSRLNPGGVFAFDIYLGQHAFTPSESEDQLPGGVTYIWEQREADPLTARVVNAMHFLLPGGTELRDAFTYDWRLWSVPELRDALREAGFSAVEVYSHLGDAIDGQGRLLLRQAGPDDLEEDDVVYIVVRR